MYIYIYIYIHMHMCVCVYMCIYVYMCVCVYICVCVYMCVYHLYIICISSVYNLYMIGICVHMCICMYVYMYIHIYIHIAIYLSLSLYTYIYIYICIHISPPVNCGLLVFARARSGAAELPSLVSGVFPMAPKKAKQPYSSSVISFCILWYMKFPSPDTTKVIIV